MRDNALQWFFNYLEDPAQYVSLNNVKLYYIAS